MPGSGPTASRSTSSSSTPLLAASSAAAADASLSTLLPEPPVELAALADTNVGAGNTASTTGSYSTSALLAQLDYVTADVVKSLNSVGKAAVLVHPGTETLAAQELPRLARRLNVLSQRTEQLPASIEIPGPFLEAIDLGQNPEVFLADWLRFARDKNADLRNKTSCLSALANDLANIPEIKNLLSEDDYRNFTEPSNQP